MKLVDKDNNSVDFGDCLVGRINYNVHYGFLVKIKKTAKCYWAYCINQHGASIKFDCSLYDKDTIQLDALNANELVKLNKILKENFEGFEEKEVRQVPPSVWLPRLAKKIKEKFNQNFNYYKSLSHYYKDFRMIVPITINKHYYEIKMDYTNSKLNFFYDENIEGIELSKNPIIQEALKV